MDSWDSKKVADFEEKVHQKVNERMRGFIRSSSFKFGLNNDYEIKSFDCDTNSGSGSVRGKITIEYSEKKNIHKYGRPGYRGNENGLIMLIVITNGMVSNANG